MLPAGKRDEIERLRRAGHVVAMVGDGINDAPALAQADIGIALASGTDVAVEAADIALLRNDIRGVGRAVVLARATMRTMRQNLFWAFAYNVVGIPDRRRRPLPRLRHCCSARCWPAPPWRSAR